MNEHHYQRIDKGVRRKHSEIEKEAREQARTALGTFLPVVSLEKRSEVILEAIEGLREGHPTPEMVAAKHQIPRSTVYSWLIADSRASEARALFFSDRLGNHLQEIELADDPLDLARAREAYRAWADIASKRDPANYGMKQEVTHTIKPEFNVILKQVDSSVLEHDVTPVLPAVSEDPPIT